MLSVQTECAATIGRRSFPASSTHGFRSVTHDPVVSYRPWKGVFRGVGHAGTGTEHTMNARFMTRRLRADMAVFRGKKDRTMFSSPWRITVPPHASTRGQREARAAVIPPEKHALLAQPVRLSTVAYVCAKIILTPLSFSQYDDSHQASLADQRQRMMRQQVLTPTLLLHAPVNADPPLLHVAFAASPASRRSFMRELDPWIELPSA